MSEAIAASGVAAAGADGADEADDDDGAPAGALLRSVAAEGAPAAAFAATGVGGYAAHATPATSETSAETWSALLMAGMAGHFYTRRAGLARAPRPRGLSFAIVAIVVRGDGPVAMAKISQCVEGATAALANAPGRTMNNRPTDRGWAVPRSGDTVAGKYVVEAPCGRGGLALILSAMHAELDRRVALKVLLPEWAGDAEMVERFLREGRTATRIKSEHVVRVFDVGVLEGGAPYLVLEYLEGTNLEDLVNSWGPLAVPTAVDWLLQAAEAIAEAHGLGIVHRDIKPANLVLTRRADGTACIKVIDFGLSKLKNPRLRVGSKNTLPTDVMGSPHYVAPEQLRSACDADERSDIWALGAVLHELVAGRPPFGGLSVPEVCAMVLTQPPSRISSVRAGVPPGLERAVLRCLEKSPGNRFATVLEMADAIAPYGTSMARSSRERIARLAEPPIAPGGVREDEITPLPPLPEQETERFSWSTDEDAGRFAPRPPPGTTLSASGVVGSLLMLTGLGAAVFMFMYDSVHADDARRLAASARAQARPAETATATTATMAETATTAERSARSTAAMTSARIPTTRRGNATTTAPGGTPGPGIESSPAIPTRGDDSLGGRK
jgi:serine/threonine protein kinase